MCSWDIYFKYTSNFQENLHVPQPKVLIHKKDSELTKHVWISLMFPSDVDQNETNRLWDVQALQAFKWSSRMDSCLIELHHNLLKCLSQWLRQWKMNVWRRMCLHRWRDHHSLLQANTNCQSFDWQVFLLDWRSSTWSKALFPFQIPNTDNSACSIYEHSFHETN